MKSPHVSAVVVLDSAVYAPIRPVNPLYYALRLPAFGFGLARALPSSAIHETARKQTAEEFRAVPPPEYLLSSTRLDVLAEPKVLHAIANEHTSNRAELAVQSTGYGSIEIPVHVVAQRDDAGRRETAERLHAEAPGGELLLVSPSGHFVQIEQADLVSELIRRAAGAH
jgi:pimeloyl-ACP methyl ester carboxylesterase